MPTHCGMTAPRGGAVSLRFYNLPLILMGCCWLLVCAASGATLAAAQTQRPRTAHLIDGRSVDLELTGIDGEWQMRFAAGTMLPSADVVYWGALTENHRSALVLLTDGSVLATDLLEVDELHVRIGVPPQSFGPPSLWRDIRLPRERLRGVILRQWPEPQRQDRLLDAVSDPTASAGGDTLWLDNGDRVSGQLARAVLYGRSPQILLRTDSGDVIVPQDRLQALALQTTRPPPASPLVGVIGFRDGSRLQVTRFEVVEDNKLRLVLSEDLSLDISDATLFWREVCYVRPPNSRVHYVSDIPPLGYRHIPFLSVPWGYGTDRNVTGGRLRAGDAPYEKGLGMHSTSRLAFEIPAGARRLQAEVAIDDSAAGKGSVVFRVYGQPATADWQVLYESPVVRGGDAPTSIHLELGDVQRVALIVDYADRGDEMDRANWLMIRFIK